MVRYASALVGSATLFFIVAGANAQEFVEVNACGQIVPNGAVGYLSANLDCTGFTAGSPAVIDPGAAVSLGAKSALDLRGFTLTGGDHGVLCNNLNCDGRRCTPHAPCEVFGGTITGAGLDCIAGSKLGVHDVTVTGCYYAVSSTKRVSISTSNVSGSAHSGILGAKVRVIECTITGNAIYGVQAQNDDHARAVIESSTITGNGTDDDCADDNPSYCADVISNRRPRLEATTCGTSAGPSATQTWGVCALD